jgi:hypothetical protein
MTNPTSTGEWRGMSYAVAIDAQLRRYVPFKIGRGQIEHPTDLQQEQIAYLHNSRREPATFDLPTLSVFAPSRDVSSATAVTHKIAHT